MACLLGVLDNIKLSDQRSLAVFTHNSENASIDSLALLFALPRQVKYTLVHGIIIGVKRARQLSTRGVLVHTQVVVSLVEEDVHSLRVAFILAKDEHFKIVDDNNSELDREEQAQRLKLWNSTPG